MAHFYFLPIPPANCGYPVQNIRKPIVRSSRLVKLPLLPLSVPVVTVRTVVRTALGRDHSGRGGNGAGGVETREKSKEKRKQEFDWSGFVE